MGAVRACARPIRHVDRRRAAEGRSRTPGATGAPLVRHVEERQLALSADVDEAAARALPADRRQGRPPRRLALAPRPGSPRGGHAGVPSAHAPSEGRGSAAHGDHGAGRERARRLEHGARLLSGRSEAVRGSGSGGAAEGARQGGQRRGRLGGGVRQGRGRVLPRVVRGAVHRTGGRGRQGGVPAASLRQRRPARSADEPGGRHLRERRADGQRARRLEGRRSRRRPPGARHLHGRQRAVPEGARSVRPSRQRPLRA